MSQGRERLRNVAQRTEKGSWSPASWRETDRAISSLLSDFLPLVSSHWMSVDFRPSGQVEHLAWLSFYLLLGSVCMWLCVCVHVCKLRCTLTSAWVSVLTCSVSPAVLQFRASFCTELFSTGISWPCHMYVSCASSFPDLTLAR